ncbi:winged helix-turn-helix domain-containing protein [Rhodanobacter denitrificans]|uniref:protein kinase domain-containing protein n=1 Tax=Rhodanobacter denitrificans TaxID=666685 RepID=UPI000260F6E0|nr:winged helix-turn-helix domain-containing protein [Rhodanobacter denitrificans]EIM04442.1 serine/threonine protein kinase [Rhodanobacter denitrificans]UJJ57898.1 winged helix-turn-helix domain-containing protein [Rhodanobacter denitrificans]UJM91772.1 winged helix-turn-helix domain-containing protein [Rhodanobacter denitrificans]
MTLSHAVPEAPSLYRWSFGKTEFDEGRWQLSMEGVVVELERKPLDVLQYLLRHAGEAVTKEELLATVWEGRIVVEAVLTNAIGKLRKALRDEEQELILTLPKVGYRLDAKVSRRVVEHVPEASRLSVGDLVPRRGNWRLEQALARRGDGEVWLARHTKTGQTRVFKFSLDGFRLTGLKREVTVGRLLEQALGKRPDLVHVIDWDFEQAPYFIEFEYGGVSLDTWQEGGSGIEALPLETRLALFVEAANTVAAAHGVGVLHKDLKPANLLVYGEPSDWHLRVADFGSSRVFDPGLLDNLGITRLGLTQTQALSSDTGTPLYLAPEVMAGQVPTIRSDIYALGVTLYQLIVGDFRRPLAAGWESDIPDPLLRADIAAAANGDPARRPESVAMLAEGIRHLEQRRQKAALEASVRDRIAVAERRAALARARRPWIAAAMLVLVAGTAVSLFYAHRSRQETKHALAATNEAKIEAAKAQKADAKATAINAFLVHNILGASNPMQSGSQTLTLQQALDQAEPKIHSSFVQHPDLEIDVRNTLINVDGARGNWKHALDQNDKIIALVDAHPHDTTLAFEKTRALIMKSQGLLYLGRLKEFDAVITPLLKQADDGQLSEPGLQTRTYYYAAERAMMAGEYTHSIHLLNKAHDAVQKLHLPGQPKAELGMKIQVDAELGQALSLAGRHNEAVTALNNLRKQVATQYGDAYPANLNVRDSLIGAEIAANHYADAQSDLDSLRRDSARVLGTDNPMSNHLDYYQGWIYLNQNLNNKALPFYAKAYTSMSSHERSTDPETIMIGMQYADIARITGDRNQAVHLLDVFDAKIKPLPTETRTPLQDKVALVRGCVLVDQGHGSQARTIAKAMDASVINTDDAAMQRLSGLTQSDAVQRTTCAVAMQ